VPVFFNPMDSEIETFDVSDIRTVIGDLVNELGKRVGGVVRTRTNVPIDLLEFIFGHESGKNHTMKWGGRRFVILGIDWANKGDKSNFGERETSAKQLSFSRGWGITGLTKFEAAETLPDENGANRAYNFHSGIPYVAAGPSQSTPKFIKSAKENLKNGIALFLDNFNSATQRMQDCTFKTPYDCKECAKAFPPTPLGDVKPDPKDPTKSIFVLKRKVSAVMFDDASTGFVRHFIGKGSLVSYAMRSAEELADLLTRGEHKLPGIDTTQPVLLQLVASDLLEFPCSWITAVLRYAGAGDQAYWYALQALWEVAGKPAPARPV
jgi:hypothetical protein